MAKQKVVIEVRMKNQKSRSNALKIAVGFYAQKPSHAKKYSEVESASIQADKGQIEVTGVGIDSAKLTMKLRKKFGYAKLVNVGDVKEEKKEEAIVAWPNGVPVPHWNCPIVRDPCQYYEDPYKCSIM